MAQDYKAINDALSKFAKLSASIETITASAKAAQAVMAENVPDWLKELHLEQLKTATEARIYHIQSENLPLTSPKE